MANGHGGARKGAGRPRLAERYADRIEAAEDKIAGKSRFLKYVDNLNKLADGGYLRERLEWKPAGLVMVEVQATYDGEPLFGKSGAPIMIKVPAFPDLPPEQLVCIGKVTEVADRDRQANEYLLNRILGKPSQAVEVTGEDGGPVEHVVFYLPANGRDAANDGDGPGG